MNAFHIEEAASILRTVHGYQSVKYVGTDGKGRMLFTCHTHNSREGDLWAVTPRHIA